MALSLLFLDSSRLVSKRRSYLASFLATSLIEILADPDLAIYINAYPVSDSDPG